MLLSDISHIKRLAMPLSLISIRISNLSRKVNIFVFISRYSDWLFAGTPGGLYISKDGGETWQDGNLWLQFDKNTRRELGGASFIDAYWRARYYGFIDDETTNKPFED